MTKIINLILFIVIFSSIIIASSLKKDETLLFYPTYAYLNKNKQITSQIHGCVYELEENSVLRKLLINGIKKIVGLNDIDEKSNRFKQLTRLFLVDNQSNKEISIEFLNNKHELSRSSSNGHFITEIELPNESKNSNIINSNKIIPYKAILPQNDYRKYIGRIQFISEKGVSVISDIDDTIKFSNVLNKKELLKNTFLYSFKPILGMPRIYQKWSKKGAIFHYVSGSPWQLFLPIWNFIQKNNFPHGSIHLKYFRLKDSSFIKFIVADQKAYKLSQIEKILNDFPKRKFILVGDSGEKDPEIYAEIAKKYSSQIKAICIRNLTGNNNQRFKNLFSKIKNSKIIIFKEANEIKNVY